MAKIKCNKCSAEKAKADFYTSNDKLVQPCKECVLKRQKELRTGTGKPSKKPGARAKARAPVKRAAKTALATRSAAAAGEFVIPAGRELRCRSDGHTYEISQDGDTVICTPEQLKAIRDWASAQLKARS